MTKSTFIVAVDIRRKGKTLERPVLAKEKASRTRRDASFVSDREMNRYPYFLAVHLFAAMSSAASLVSFHFQAVGQSP